MKVQSYKRRDKTKKLITLLSIFTLIIAFSIPAAACEGPNCSASGNFDINTTDHDGDVDAGALLVPGGITGGISGAGGIVDGNATGKVGKFLWFNLGEAGAELNTTAGGITQTHSYTFTNGGAHGIGTQSDGQAVVSGNLKVNALGVAGSAGEFAGAAGQGTLDGSLIMPKHTNGFSGGIAGQGSGGAIIGAAGTVGLGNADISAGIDMRGSSGSESYRGTIVNGDAKSEYMGTNVADSTIIISSKDVERHGLALAAVEGGYEAAGFAKSLTVQTTNSGLAIASANGSYNGSGELGCDFSGSLVGGTFTQATKVDGYKGSIMSSSSNMHITINR